MVPKDEQQNHCDNNKPVQIELWLIESVVLKHCERQIHIKESRNCADLALYSWSK